MRVLIVEDDPAIADGIADALTGGYEVHRAADGTAAIALIDSIGPELVILDLGLPDMDGGDVVRALRARGEVPVIVVSARSDEVDRVVALELGADDYLVKPFGMRELLARIRAVTRRSAASAASAADDAIRLPRFELDPRTRRVLVDDAEVRLTPTEFDLLQHLAADPGAVLRRADILREVWQTEWYGATKTLDAHIAALRRKLGGADWIESVRGVGFRFEPPTASGTGASDPATS